MSVDLLGAGAGLILAGSILDGLMLAELMLDG
jgi:hypothetical protein